MITYITMSADGSMRGIGVYHVADGQFDVLTEDGGDPQLLGDDPVLAFAYWPSPNGEWLAYAAPDGGGLHLSRADGSEDRPVHPTTPADMGASWSADSSGFVFSSAGEEPRTSSSCGSTRKLRSSSPMIRRMTVRRIVDRRAADPRALARVAYRIG